MYEVDQNSLNIWLRTVQRLKISGMQGINIVICHHQFANFCVGLESKLVINNYYGLLQNAGLAEALTSLRNHVAELEEEKGNLQLQLLEMEEANLKQGSLSLPTGI